LQHSRVVARNLLNPQTLKAFKKEHHFETMEVDSQTAYQQDKRDIWTLNRMLQRRDHTTSTALLLNQYHTVQRQSTMNKSRGSSDHVGDQDDTQGGGEKTKPRRNSSLGFSNPYSVYENAEDITCYEKIPRRNSHHGFSNPSYEEAEDTCYENSSHSEEDNGNTRLVKGGFRGEILRHTAKKKIIPVCEEYSVPASESGYINPIRGDKIVRHQGNRKTLRGNEEFRLPVSKSNDKGLLLKKSIEEINLEEADSDGSSMEELYI